MPIVIDKLSGKLFLFDFPTSGGTGSGSTYVEVNTFADLPPAGTATGEIYVVLVSSGIYLINRKEAGLYYSNGSTWRRLGDIPSFFDDDNFRIYDGNDNSKEVRFQISGVTPSTTRTITVRNSDGTIAYLSDITSYTGATAPILNAAVTGGTSLGGIAVFKQKTGRNLEFKGLVAGMNIMLTPSATGITITSTTSATGGTPYNVFTGYTASTEVRLDTIQEYAAYGIGTGFLSGGTITHTGGTTFTVHAGVGLYIDQYTDTTNPIVIPVSWNSTVLPVLTGSVVTYVSVSSGGTFVTRMANPNPQERREEIFLGLVIHPLGTITSVNESALPAYDILPTTHDLAQAVGLIKIDDGNKIIPFNGDLEVTKTEGSIFFLSTNIRNNNKNPNFRTFVEETPLIFQYRDIESTDFGNTTFVDPTKYERVDSGGTTSTILTITGSTAQATVQRIYMFQSGGVRFQYGQKVYSSLEQAFTGFLSDDFVVEQDIDEDALLIGILVIRVETVDLSNGADAIFVSTDRYGSILGTTNGHQFVINNYQIVKTLADFPEPTTASTIQLQDDFEYRINGFVNIGANRLILGSNNTIIGENTGTDTIVGTNTGPLIYGRNKSATLNTVSFRNLNTGGTVVDLVGANANNLVARRLIFLSTRGGKVGGYGLTIMDNMLLENMVNGFTISGQSTNQGLLSIRNIVYRNPQSGSTGFVITGGSFNSIDLSLSYFSPDIGRTALRINSGTTLTTSGTLIANQFFGTGTYLAGTLTKAAPNWNFVANTNLNDSQTYGFLKFSGNTSVTVITATTQYIKAAGTNSSTAFERVIVGNNRLTNNSNKTQAFDILLTGDVTVASGTETLELAVYKNGTTKVGNVEIRTSMVNQPTPFAYNDIATLAQNDYVEVFVRNQTSTADIILRTMQFRMETP